jgi:hypothetical protein
MEIEFTPNQPAATRVNWAVKGAATSPPASQDSPLQGMGDLQKKLNDLALTRPEKIEAARLALSDVKYPPEQLLNGISHLLAIKLSQ